MNSSVSRRYARALFYVALEGIDEKSDPVEQVYSRLQALADAVESSPELLSMVDDPQYSRETLSAIVGRILEQQGPELPPLSNLVRLLADRRRLGAIPEIARVYGRFADERAGRLRGHVTTAVPLSEETLERLETALERVTQREVVLDARVDPKLLGGVATQLGSTLYDGSLRSQLETLRRTLKVA